MAATASRRYTTDDLEPFPDDGRLRELVDGQVVEWGLANLRHGLVINALAYFLNAFVRPNRLGSVALANTLVRILGSRYNARGGDVLPGFTLRMRDILDELAAELASDEPESEQESQE